MEKRPSYCDFECLSSYNPNGINIHIYGDYISQLSVW